LDKTGDGSLDSFEMFSMFSAWDMNKDFSVSADELMKWMIVNEYMICRPFEKEVSKLMKKSKVKPTTPKEVKNSKIVWPELVGRPCKVAVSLIFK
jgi:hypothetical protein